MSAQCGRANPNSLAVFCGQDEDWLFKTFGDDPVLKHIILAAQGGLSEEEMEDFERKSRNNVNFGGAFFARVFVMAMVSRLCAGVLRLRLRLRLASVLATLVQLQNCGSALALIDRCPANGCSAGRHERQRS